MGGIKEERIKERLKGNNNSPKIMWRYGLVAKIWKGESRYKAKRKFKYQKLEYFDN